jgi:hypothetical protein
MPLWLPHWRRRLLMEHVQMWVVAIQLVAVQQRV